MILAFYLPACSPEAGLSAKESPEDGGLGGDTANEGTDDSEADDDVEVSWFAPAARLMVADGAGSAEGAEIHLRQADARGEDVRCDVPLDVTDLEAAAPPSASVSLWWELPEVVPADDRCVGASLPQSLGLGIGVLDPEVRARLGTVDRDDEADALYGAWVRIDGGEVLAVGFAAPTDTSEPASEAPPDDVYDLEPLFLFPVAE